MLPTLARDVLVEYVTHCLTAGEAPSAYDQVAVARILADLAANPNYPLAERAARMLDDLPAAYARRASQAAETIALRSRRRDFDGFLAVDTFDEIARRLANIARRGPMTIVQWHDPEHPFGSLDATTNETLDALRRHPAGAVGIERRDGDRPYRALRLALTRRLLGFSIGTEWEHERDAAFYARAIAKRPDYERSADLTYVEITGGTEPDAGGLTERACITYTNEHGARTWTVIKPEYVERRARVAQQAAIVEQVGRYLAAATGPGVTVRVDTPTQACERLARTLRDEEQTLNEALAAAEAAARPVDAAAQP